MKRLTFCLLLAMLALSGCATPPDYGSSGGATRSPSEAPGINSPWSNDWNFIAPPA